MTGFVCLLVKVSPLSVIKNTASVKSAPVDLFDARPNNEKKN